MSDSSYKTENFNEAVVDLSSESEVEVIDNGVYSDFYDNMYEHYDDDVFDDGNYFASLNI